MAIYTRCPHCEHLTHTNGACTFTTECPICAGPMACETAFRDGDSDGMWCSVACHLADEEPTDRWERAL